MTRSRILTTSLCLPLAAAAVGFIALIGPAPAEALGNGVAKTPPMGWNSWNSFGCNPSETLVKQMADAMVSSGMKDAGYEYVVIDDCWFNPNRDSSGNIQPNTSRFPNGMKAIGDYLHSKGLKFGIYEGPLSKTCAQYFNSYPGATGSQGHEYADAKQFASWGVDYLKYDWCDPSGSIDEQVRTFAIMRDALASTGRPIVYSINSNSVHSKTGPQRNWGDVANMWRTTEDIQDMWLSNQTNGYPMGVQNIVNVTVPLASYAAPGAWNDMDMLEVGRGGMTETEQRSHFALWAIMNSPLIAGNDLRSMSSTTRDILTNRDLIAINQDSLGMQAKQIAFDGTRRVLAKPMADGSVAVALLNQGTSTTTITTSAAAIGATGSSFTLKDAWTKASTTTTGSISASVPGHGVVVYRVTPSSTPTTTSTTSQPPQQGVVLASTFENGTDSWSGRGAASVAAAGSGRSGSALSVAGRTSTWNGATRDVTSVLQTGQTYYVEAWARMASGASSESLNLSVERVSSGTTAYDRVGDAVSASSGDWVRLSGSYTVPSDASSLQLYVEGDATGSFLVDDVTVSTEPITTTTKTKTTTKTTDPTTTTTTKTTTKTVKLRTVKKCKTAKNGQKTCRTITKTITKG